MSRVVSVLMGDANMVTEEVIDPSYITEWQVKGQVAPKSVHRYISILS